MNLSEIIRKRRSIRKYRDKDIPREFLQEILQDALWAPSGTNRQNWDIYVVRGEKKEKILSNMVLAAEIFKPTLDRLFPEDVVKVTLNFFKNIGGAPVVLLVYIPRYTYNLEKEMGNKEKWDIEHDRITSALSAAALVQNILLLAKEKGLGTCWMTAMKHVEDQINTEMGITDKELISVVTIGYPDENPRAPRRKGEKIHWVGY